MMNGKSKISETDDDDSIAESKRSARSNLKIILLCSGAFNPPTFQHFRIFERAKDYLEKTHAWTVEQGFICPIASKFAGIDLVSSKHRMKMCELMAEKSKWISVDHWQCEQNKYVKPLDLLNHYKMSIGSKCENNSTSKMKMILLCGSDYFEHLDSKISSEPSSKLAEIEEIVKFYRLIVLRRPHSDPIKILYLSDILRKYQKNIHMIDDDTCPSNMSSAHLRTALRRNESIQYCTDDKVISYIENHSLYSCNEQTSRRNSHKFTLNDRPTPPERTSSNGYQNPSSLFSSMSESTEIPHASCTIIESDNNEWNTAKCCIAVPVKKELLSSIHSGEAGLNGECMNDVREAHRLQLKSLTMNGAEISGCSVIGKSAKRLDSPNYDNVTLDELLTASTTWLEALAASTSGASSKKPTAASEFEEKPDKDERRRQIRFASESSENIRKISVQKSNDEYCFSRQTDAISNKEIMHENECLVEESKSGNVILKYRQYNLASTPETTV